ncbi:hypothetical protein FB45DRAFT_11973 [Roridomyces roridus]|uniref:Store-operated calcium entry-associated regulatory factor n=1 Tax=Roridomyces roridus TaxID=1738132 RepID=A0AAD7CLC4_9AGAR|nr:hypothetical protein FB45DRAFT_11973 [Roridomyces roridus]
MSRIELAKIPALTFYKDSFTEARRTEPIPQLRCLGKPCQLYQPDVVRCTSLGGRGSEIDWKCDAELPDSLRLGRVEVSCEGYSRPGDPYVLKGSCGLEYRLIQLPSDHQSGGKSYDVASMIFTVVWLAFLAIILYSFLQSCFRGPQNRVPGRPEPGRPGYGGFFPGGLNNDDPSAPPPYSKNPPAEAANEGWRPGFWTGALLGGLGTHLYNNNNNRQNTRAYDWERRQQTRYNSPAGGSSFRRRPNEDRGEGPSNLGSMRQSTGFGGSSVR